MAVANFEPFSCCLNGFSKTLCRKWAFFSLFTNKQFLQQNNVKKCSSSIRCWDSNPRPLAISVPFKLLLPRSSMSFHFNSYTVSLCKRKYYCMAGLQVEFDQTRKCVVISMSKLETSGQSYKASTIVIYDSRVVPDLKIPHIMTLES